MMQRKKSEPYAQEKININLKHVTRVEKKSSFYTLFNPSAKYYRFVALYFMCWLGFAANFCYDNPSALQDSLIRDLNITSTQFSLLYSVHAWPSIIICIIGGVLIDSIFGIRLGTNIYMGITLFGQLIYASGALLNEYWIMVFGRLVFGIGSEPLGVAQKKYAVTWFKGKELSMVFGLHSSCNSIASVLTFWTMDPLYNWTSNFYSGHQLIGVVLFIGSITCVVSMACSVILGVIDKKAANTLKREESNTVNVITFNDVRNFHWSFWLIVFIRSTIYVAIFSFIALSKVFFMSEFSMTSTGANRLSSFMFVIAITGAPILGTVTDKTGKNIYWLILGAMCTVAAHCMLAFTYWNPFIAVILLSVSACILTSSTWPAIALTIPTHQLGTAYGLCWSCTNLLLSVITIMAGSIIDYAGYFWFEVFFIIISLVALLATVVLLVANSIQNGILNMTPSERELLQRDTHASSALQQQDMDNVYTISTPEEDSSQQKSELDTCHP